MTLASRVRAMEKLTEYGGGGDWCRCVPELTVRVWYPDDDDEPCSGPSYCTQCRRQKQRVGIKVIYDDPPATVGWKWGELIDGEAEK